MRRSHLSFFTGLRGCANRDQSARFVTCPVSSLPLRPAPSTVRRSSMQEPFWRWVTSPSVRPAGRPETTLIVPQLLIGEYPTPDDAEWLRTTHQVTAVLSLQDDADLASKGLDLVELERAYRTHGVRFHRAPLPDGDTEVLRTEL